MNKIGHTIFYFKEEELRSLNNEIFTYKNASMRYPNIYFRFVFDYKGTPLELVIILRQSLYSEKNSIRVTVNEPEEEMACFEESEIAAFIEEFRPHVEELVEKFQHILVKELSLGKHRLRALTQELFQPVDPDYISSLYYILEN